jgi:hypothetical protein
VEVVVSLRVAAGFLRAAAAAVDLVAATFPHLVATFPHLVATFPHLVAVALALCTGRDAPSTKRLSTVPRLLTGCFVAAELLHSYAKQGLVRGLAR